MSTGRVEAVADLLERSAQPGLAPVAWSSVTAEVAALKARAGEDLTTVALAGDGWQTAAEDEWPSEVTGALERLGWPAHWDPRSLVRLWDPVTSAEARGFVSGVKGAVFEQEVVDRVESGELSLPGGGDGLRLAEDVQQPGWDAQVLDGDQVIGVVQMKATDSVAYVAGHVDRYPGVDTVITTSEVARAAADRGLTVVTAAPGTRTSRRGCTTSWTPSTRRASCTKQCRSTASARWRCARSSRPSGAPRRRRSRHWSQRRA